ncbi:hypothetical protein FD754_021888 [Muntiacus muntjak]|uniref:XK-related protein n=1 Tax=Muntiacus muntjak TaxID=9888 RepID=A0A5N3V6T5_MUNMU|nr:hypothetical protein FD754_021888 [Muntiacus muntjak]
MRKFIPNNNEFLCEIGRLYLEEFIWPELSGKKLFKCGNYLEYCHDLPFSFTSSDEGFLISPCYSLELCIQMGISFLFSFAFHFSSFLSYCKASSDNHFAFLYFFFLGIMESKGVLVSVDCEVDQDKESEHSTLSLLSSGVFMVLSLLSIVYGALRCNILAIKIKYDEYDVKVKPLAYVCIFLWRSFEIVTRVIVLVLFTSVLKAWVVIDILINFLGFLFYPWILFWCSGSPFPENFEKAFSRLGTTIVLCFLTLLYAGINMFCWSAVQLKINNPDLISKSQNWYRLLVYYMVRFIENAFLLLMWYLYKTDIYMYVCAPLLMLQLLIGYCTAVLFMVVFYQFFHPCKKLFSSSVSESFQEWLKCACCYRRRRESCESAEKTDLRSPADREETPSSSKISSMPSQILNTDELSSA